LLLLVLTEDFIQFPRFQISIQIVTHHHCRSVITRAQTRHWKECKSTILGRLAWADAEAGGKLLAELLRTYDPTTDAIAQKDHVSAYRSAEDEIIEGGHAVEFLGCHLEEFGDIPNALIGYPATMTLHGLERLDADGLFVWVVVQLSLYLLSLFWS
jgi:hypothetical protein